MERHNSFKLIGSSLEYEEAGQPLNIKQILKALEWFKILAE